MHNLMGHMHLHSDSKPFKCLYCPSKFTLKGNLTRHMKVKHGVMDRGLDERCKDAHHINVSCILHVKGAWYTFSFFMASVFRQRGRYCLSNPMSLLTHFSQEEPFDLSQKPPGLPGLCLSQSDGESVPGSSCQEEDEESLYRRSQYSPEVDQHELEEREQGSPAEATPGEEQKQMYQRSLDEETYEREPAAKGRSVDPRGDQMYHHQTGRRQSYDFDSDSELEDHQQEFDEQSKKQIDVFCDEAERKQSRSETGEFMEVRGSQDEEEEDRDGEE